jgi:Protein of unknown function (DUF2971)
MNPIETPQTIFKYTSFDMAKVIVSTSAIKFSRPTEFNDPFDCDIDLLDFNFTSDLNEKVKAEIVQLKETFKDKPGFAELSSKNSLWERGYRETQIGKINSCRISCFSLLNDSILMWSHYADKHYGICLEFDNIASPRFVNLSDSKDISEGIVDYSEYERINYLSSDRMYAIKKLFISKSTSWSHEQEYRMILLGNKPEIQKFNRQFLKAIFFGLRVGENEINEMVILCKLHGFTDLSFYKCQKNNLSIKFMKLNLS